MAYHRILAAMGFVLVLGVAPGVQTAELSPINFVSSGSGGIVEVIRFSQKQGFFKKQGLDVTMIYVPSGVLAAQTVVSGSALIANNSVSDILNAIAAGAPLKILTVNIDRFQHLFVARPGINSPKDMKGKKVAVSRYGAFSDIETRFLIRQWGMDPDRDVQVLQIGNSAARSAALMSGGIDGAVVTPAFVPVARNAGLNVIFDLGVFVGDLLIQKQPRLHWVDVPRVSDTGECSATPYKIEGFRRQAKRKWLGPADYILGLCWNDLNDLHSYAPLPKARRNYDVLVGVVRAYSTR